MIYKVVVVGVGGKKMEIDLCNTEEQFKTFTVGQLKEKIFLRLSYYNDQLRLIFVDKPLDRESTLLCDYGIQHMSVILAVFQLPGGEPLEEEDGGIGDNEKNTKMVFRVVVYGLIGEKMLIDLCNTEEQFNTFTMGQLKKKILQQGPRKFVDPDDLLLVFQAHPLEGDSTLLCDYGIQHLSYIHLLLKLPGKGDGGMGDKDKN